MKTDLLSMLNRRFTKVRIESAVSEAGFKVIDCSYANALLLPVALFKFRVWEDLTRQVPQSGVTVPAAPLNSLLERILGVEAAWLGRGGHFPVGQSILVLATKES